MITNALEHAEKYLPNQGLIRSSSVYSLLLSVVFINNSLLTALGSKYPKFEILFIITSTEPS